MYCIKCGVELSDEKKPCPLCSTIPYHPEIEGTASEPTYPPFVKPERKMKKWLVMLFLTILYTLSAGELALCDIIVSSRLSWSVFAIGGMALLYVAVILPHWFKKPNPVIFTPCSFAAAALYLMLISMYTHGGWFVTFALPITAAAGLIFTAVVTLVKYVRKGYFFIIGGAIIALGGLVIVVEALATVTFSLGKFHFWSVYPASGALLLGLGVIVLGICPSIRNWFSKKFFI
jgi:hypothetical protein